MVTDLNLFGESGGEHHCLSVSHGRHRVLLYDAPDLRLKPHVQHSVCLIQNQVPRVEGERGEGLILTVEITISPVYNKKIFQDGW